MTDRPQAPACPYCTAPWTARMLEQFDLHANGSSCACCGGRPHPADSTPAAVPEADLCCEACGKPIYRAPMEGHLHD